MARWRTWLPFTGFFIDYGAYLDTRDFDAYSALFAEDAEVLLGPMGRAKGRDNIKALMEGTLSGSQAASFHLISSPKSPSTATPQRPG